MQRAHAIVVGAVLGAAGLAGLVAGTAASPTAPAALDDGRRASARWAAPAAPPTVVACVRGADGLAPAVADALALDVRSPDGRLRTAALASIGAASFAAARDREAATRAPALPQRMGLVDGHAVTPGERCADRPAFAALAVAR